MARAKNEEIKKTVRRAAQVATDTAESVVTKAKKVAPQKPEVFLQYNDKEVDTNAVVAEAKAAFKAEAGRVAVRSCQIYLKPEENAAYYVINSTFTGRIDL